MKFSASLTICASTFAIAIIARQRSRGNRSSPWWPDRRSRCGAMSPRRPRPSPAEYRPIRQAPAWRVAHMTNCSPRSCRADLPGAGRSSGGLPHRLEKANPFNDRREAGTLDQSTHGFDFRSPMPASRAQMAAFSSAVISSSGAPAACRKESAACLNVRRAASACPRTKLLRKPAACLRGLECLPAADLRRSVRRTAQPAPHWQESGSDIVREIHRRAADSFSLLLARASLRAR